MNYNFTIKKHLTKICVILGMMLSGVNVSYAQLSGNYTIDPNSGASSTNYTTFTDFANDLNKNGTKGGVVVQVVAGSKGPITFNEQVIFNEINGASPKSPIIIYGNGNILSFAAQSSSDMFTLKMDGADYFQISNLNIVADGSDYGWGVLFSNRADENILDSCTISCPNNGNPDPDLSAGIVFSSSTYSTYKGAGENGYNNIIRNSSILGGGKVGFYFGIFEIQNDYNTSSNNQFINNDIQDFYAQGIYSSNTYENKYIGNSLHRPNTGSSSDVVWVFYSENCQDMEYSKNRIYDMYSSVSYSKGYTFGCFQGTYPVGTTKIINNAMYNNDMDGNFFAVQYYDVQYQVDIYHNTFQYKALPGTGKKDYHEVHCVYLEGYGKQVYNLKDNVFDVEEPGVNGMVEVLWLYQGTPDIFIDYNMWNVNAPNYQAKWAFIADGNSKNDYYDLNSLQNAKYEGGGFEDVPAYKDLKNGDLTLTGANQNKKGIDVGVKDDIKGATRGSVPDVGAFELEMNLQVNSVSLPKSSDCESQEREVTLEIENLSSASISNIIVEYKIDANGVPVTDTIKSTLTQGKPLSFAFAKKLVLSAGNHTLYGYIKGDFAGAASFSFTVNSSPLGSGLTQGNPYVGIFKSGQAGDPDIAGEGDKITYELKAPNGYTNSQFGKQWGIKNVSFTTNHGASVPTSDTVSQNPGSNAGTFSFTPSSATIDSTYKLQYVVYSIANGCEAPAITREIYVAPKPTADFTFNVACGGQRTKFVNASKVASGIYTVSWDFGDGNTSDFMNPDYLYQQNGSYQVKMVITTNFGFKDSVTKTVGVYDNPTANFTFKNTCDMNPGEFKATSTSPNAGAIVNNFDFGDGTSATGDDLTHTYSTFGEFTVTLNITDAVGCVSSVSKNFTHSEKPDVEFTINNGSKVCSNTNIKFTNLSQNSADVGYEWNLGDGTTEVSTNASHTYSADGTYDVQLIARSGAGCVDTVTKSVSVVPGADIKIASSGNCNGQMVTFTNSTIELTGTSYVWNFGDGSTSFDREPKHQYGSIGTFDVEVVATTTIGCVTKIKETIIIGEKPVVYFTLSKQSVCTDDVIQFSNGSYSSSSALTYVWDFGNGNKSTLKNPTTQYQNSGNVEVVLIATAGVCSDTFKNAVTVTQTPDATYAFASEGLGLGGIVFTPTINSGTGDYRWSLGDGATESNKTSFTHRYTANGYYKVCLERNDNGCISTDCQYVTISTSSVGQSSEVNFSVYPNPNNGDFKVKFNNVVSNNVQVTITNILGEVISTYANNDISNGTLSINMDTQPAGIYFVKMMDNNIRSSEKITLIK